MKVGLFSSSEFLSEMLVNELFLFGMAVYHVKTPMTFFQFQQFIEEKQINCLFLDFDMEGFEDGMEIIRFIRSRPHTKNIKIVVFTSSKQDEFLTQIVIEGADAVFDTNMPFSSYVRKIKGILSRLEKTSDEKREYIRVHLEPEEQPDTVLILANQKGTYTGKVTDISAAAAAILLDQTENLESLLMATYINNLQIKINYKTYACRGRILRIAGNVIIVGFLKRNAFFNEGIVDLIYRKINQ